MGPDSDEINVIARVPYLSNGFYCAAVKLPSSVLLPDRYFAVAPGNSAGSYFACEAAYELEVCKAFARSNVDYYFALK